MSKLRAGEAQAWPSMHDILIFETIDTYINWHFGYIIKSEFDTK
jgi:hypothetical protein